jgi:hypothetical protein
MHDQNNTADNHGDSNQRDADAHRNGVPDGFERQLNDAASQEGQQARNAHPKRPVGIRLWRGLWRKRIFWRDRHDRPHVNWAEITTVCLTIGIVIAAFIQAFIYWKQAGIMQRSLDQNQQTIALNMGQVAIASRNAKTAEDTLSEIQEGGNDTHELAVQAKNQAHRAKEIAERTLTQATATNTLAQHAERSAKATEDAVANARQSLEFQQRPWITLSFEFGHDVAEGSMSAIGTIKNVGNGPALTTIVFVGTSTQFCGGPNGTLPAAPPYDPVKTWPAVRILPPTISADLEPHDFKIDPFTIGLISEGICTLYVYADARFCDVFHIGHYQHYCGKWVPNTPHKITACDTYNDGDQDHADQGTLACMHLPPHMAIMMPKIPPDLLPQPDEKK